MGLMEIPYAPDDITPEKYFKEWLPEQFEKFGALAEQFGGDISACMSVKVDGEEWTCAIDQGKLSATPGLNDDAVVTIVISEQDFKDAVTGKMNMTLSPPGGGGGTPDPDKLKEMAKNNLEALKGIDGVLQYRLENDDGSAFVATIKFAGPMKDSPDTVVSMAREDAEAMAKGELNPQTAFMAGKVNIQGDMGMLMQMMPLMNQ